MYAEELYSTSSRNVEELRLFEDFDSEMGRMDKVINDKPIFMKTVKNDYRLKDLTPGFLAGKDNKNIGLQMNVNADLMSYGSQEEIE